jgi:hypothetical protein
MNILVGQSSYVCAGKKDYITETEGDLIVFTLDYFGFGKSELDDI